MQEEEEAQGTNVMIRQRILGSFKEHTPASSQMHLNGVLKVDVYLSASFTIPPPKY